MRVRLIRKLAPSMDGVDVSRLAEGDIVELPEAEARLLIAEGWAVPDGAPAARGGFSRLLCPVCGKPDAIALERVIVGARAIKRYHCRACGSAWDATPEEG